MIERILKSSHLLILSIVLTTSIFFSGAYQANADQIINDNSEGHTLSKEIEDVSKMIEIPNTSLTPDLGDDQAFPFIPGFGKN